MEIPCPDQFDFNTENWPAWKARFLRYRAFSDLGAKPDMRQINALLYCMGSRADDILRILRLSDEESKKFDTVLDKFDKHFVARRNVIYERVQFNRRRQNAGEKANDFITALFKLADTCDYGTLKDELIRDRLVVGISDSRLCETLQKDADLTLEKAIATVRQSEQVREQQESLRADSHAGSEVHAIKGKDSRHQSLPKHNKAAINCKFCGRTHSYSIKHCPAWDKNCNKCNKKDISPSGVGRASTSTPFRSPRPTLATLIPQPRTTYSSIPSLLVANTMLGMLTSLSTAKIFALR